MSCHRFDIAEPTPEGYDGVILMDGKRLCGVKGYMVKAFAGDVVIVTVTFIAASVNRATFDEITKAPSWDTAGPWQKSPPDENVVSGKVVES